MKIEVHGVPVPQGSKVIMRGRLVDVRSKDLKAWRRAIAYAATNTHDPIETDAVRVALTFYLPRPKTVIRKYPSVRPDLDKLARACLDALTGIAYLDDSQVCDLTLHKRYQNEGGIGVRIEVDPLP